MTTAKRTHPTPDPYDYAGHARGTVSGLRGGHRPAGSGLDVASELQPESLLCWQDFARDWRRSGKSPLTVVNYGQAVAQFAAFMGGPGGREVIYAGRRDALAFLDDLTARGLSAGSITTYHRSLRSWLNHVGKSFRATGEDPPPNPFAQIELRESRPPRTPVLTDDKLRALMAACDKAAGPRGSEPEMRRFRDAAIIGVWAEAGCPRRAEIAAFVLTDVDMAAGTVTIRKGKGGKRRVIPISDATALKLSRWLRVRAAFLARRPMLARRAGPSLWITVQGGMSAAAFGKMLDVRGEQAGLGHLHPHQLRHTSYHRSRLAGIAPDEAMRLFGWDSDTMTRLYGADGADLRAQDKARRVAIGDLDARPHGPAACHGCSCGEHHGG